MFGLGFIEVALLFADDGGVAEFSEVEARMVELDVGGRWNPMEAFG